LATPINIGVPLRCVHRWIVPYGPDVHNQCRSRESAVNKCLGRALPGAWDRTFQLDGQNASTPEADRICRRPIRIESASGTTPGPRASARSVDGSGLSPRGKARARDARASGSDLSALRGPRAAP
jgi:hypothetical protein